ncbi:MAG: DUF1801 domain-containing protein [Pyrinomonadaceae bacterium]
MPKQIERQNYIVGKMKPSEQIDEQIADLNDWRGEMIAKLRKLIHSADPDIVEDWKWNTAVFVHKGNVCALGAFKDHVKINFFKGASLQDPNGLFNAGLDAKASRSIDLYKGDKIDAKALTGVLQEAVALNNSEKSKIGTNKEKKWNRQ